MAGNRKLGKTTDIRLSMLKNLTTDLVWHEKLETTLARAKEVKAIVDSLIALAIKEKDNFEEIEVKITKAKLNSKGQKETVVAKSKNGNEFLKVVKEEVFVKKQKDSASRLNARRKIMTKVNKVKDTEGNPVDLADKLLNTLATRYQNRECGFTQIYKLGQRRGDAAEKVIIKLV